MQRRSLLSASAAALALPAIAWSQAVEKPKLTIAVGGKNLLYYLPLTIAETQGYFKAEGLDVTIADFAGGSRALQALIGGSADVTSGADLKGKKLGVTAPGSSTQVLANFVLAKAGLKPGDISIIGVGAGNGAVAAMRAGQIDAISNLDPVITLLVRSGDLKIISDTRVVAEADRIFGGPMPAGCLYTQQTFIDRYPATTQALANATVRADRWIHNAGPGDIIKAVPENYLLGDRAVYVDAFLAAKGALSPDGMIPEAGAETARRALASIDPEIANAKIDLAAIWTNDFTKRANAQYAKG